MMAGVKKEPTAKSTLLITSCMAPITDRFVGALADYVARRLDIDARFVDEVRWQERERWLDEGRAHVGWLCGLPYVWKADGAGALQLLAAPVMEGERYGGRPVYYSDVVVHRESRIASFEDLRSAAWAYNEPRSHSGYLLTRYNLALRGLNGDFFGRIVGAGSHQRALEMILAREIDGSAIDSTVLALVMEAEPEIGDQIRVLESWGPSPIPPWLVHREAPAALQQKVQQLLLDMHDHEEGRAVLKLARVARFVTVEDADYDPIRHMARQAENVTLGERL